eukprot:scaffold6000_cov184-Isochrysis_galbana.AAC.2
MTLEGRSSAASAAHAASASAPPSAPGGGQHYVGVTVAGGLNHARHPLLGDGEEGVGGGGGADGVGRGNRVAGAPAEADGSR